MVTNEYYTCINGTSCIIRIHNKQAVYVGTEEGFSQANKESEEMNRIYHDNREHTIIRKYRDCR
jgi:hypothetical protein